MRVTRGRPGLQLGRQVWLWLPPPPAASAPPKPPGGLAGQWLRAPGWSPGSRQLTRPRGVRWDWGGPLCRVPTSRSAWALGSARGQGGRVHVGLAPCQRDLQVLGRPPLAHWTSGAGILAWWPGMSKDAGPSCSMLLPSPGGPETQRAQGRVLLGLAEGRRGLPGGPPCTHTVQLWARSRLVPGAGPLCAVVSVPEWRAVSRETGRVSAHPERSHLSQTPVPRCHFCPVQ